MERNCIEVRWHGRGGQGAVTAASILAEAAFYDGYKGVTSAPFFGAERRGAPIIATTRFGWKPVRTFSLVETPDVVVVLDETLINVVDVTAGIRPDGIVIINTAKPPEDIELKGTINIATTDANRWAREAGLIVSGTVISNTAILGGFARATGLIAIESLKRALMDSFSKTAAEKNINGARLAYRETLLLKECNLKCA